MSVYKCCMAIWVPSEAGGEHPSNSLELELQSVMRFLKWVLGTEP